jgi:hypothetical protein
MREERGKVRRTLYTLFNPQEKFVRKTQERIIPHLNLMLFSLSFSVFYRCLARFLSLIDCHARFYDMLCIFIARTIHFQRGLGR